MPSVPSDSAHSAPFVTLKLRRAVADTWGTR